jgi:hypothetical protein
MRLPRAALVLVALLLAAVRVHADGGVVVLDGRAGPLLVTAFAAPVPLRAGPVDLSVLVRDVDGTPLFDVDVHLVLELVEAEAREDAAEAGAVVTGEHGMHADGPADRNHAGHGSGATHPGGGTTVARVRATRAQATNKLLHAALVELPVPGTWRLVVEVVRDSTSSRLAGTLPVGPALPAWTTRWRELLLPALVVALFLLHQVLAARGATPAPGRTSAPP